MTDEFFEPWLGAVGRDRTFLADLTRRVFRGGYQPSSRSRRFHFDGSRIGRGAGIGRILSLRKSEPTRWANRALVTHRLAKLVGGGGTVPAAHVHMRYLCREGTARDGGRAPIYGPNSDNADRIEFVQKSKDDRNQFRFVLEVEDGHEYDDLKPLVRRLMQQAARDLRVKPDWVAADHFNTGRPHSHIVMRGRDEKGDDIIIAREYLRYGLSARAAELVEADLGPMDISTRSLVNEAGALLEKYTQIDAELLASRDADNHVRAFAGDGHDQCIRATRLQFLNRLGLAKEVGSGNWSIVPDLAETLTALERCNDRTAVVDHVCRDADINISPADYVTHRARLSAPLIGSILFDGIPSDSAFERAIVLDGIDGRIHYVPVDDARRFDRGSIVKIAPSAALEGQYTAPRLAMPIGAQVCPVTILSGQPLSELPAYEGETWLDRELVAERALVLGRGFGAQVAAALKQRAAWLEARGLTFIADGQAVVQPDLLQTLRDLEKHRGSELFVE